MRSKKNWRARLEEHQRKKRGQNPGSYGGPQARAVSYPGDLKIFVFACLCLIVVPVTAANLAKAGPLDIPSLPAAEKPNTPAAGVYYFSRSINGSMRPVTELTVYNNSRDGASHMLSFRTQGTNDRIVDAFVPAGETVTIPLPIGTYDLYSASGKRWHSDEKLFGWRTVQRRHVKPFVVERNQTHFIRMDGGLDGNMRSVPALY